MRETDFDRQYGPDKDMSGTGKAMLTYLVAQMDCRCKVMHDHGSYFPCVRCQTLQEIKEAWPWWYFTTLGNMGANRGV